MKPGSLVTYDSMHSKAFGIIIRESKNTNLLDGKSYQWWEVLLNDKIISKSEGFLKLIVE